MSSPFIYEEPVRPGELIDRSEELRTLVDRALDARNSRLEGPRRFGKTSLLRAALATAEHEGGAIAIEVNFLGCVSASDVAQRIERAYGAQLRGPVRRWFEGLVRTLQPTFSLAPGGIGVSAAPALAAPGLLDRLALPRRVAGTHGTPVRDRVRRVSGDLPHRPRTPGTFRSELETHGDAAGYVFSGSHPGLMRDLFSDRRHAFFGQAAPIELGPLNADDLATHITARFAGARRDPGEGLGPLLDTSEGHPQRAMLLAHHLYGRTRAGSSATIEQWTAAQQSAEREAGGEIQILWQSCTPLERKVLKVVAFRTVPLTGREAAQRFGLAKSGSTRAAVQRLVGDGHLAADRAARTGWRVVDPFLAAWLRRDD